MTREASAFASAFVHHTRGGTCTHDLIAHADLAALALAAPARLAERAAEAAERAAASCAAAVGATGPDRRAALRAFQRAAEARYYQLQLDVVARSQEIERAEGLAGPDARDAAAEELAGALAPAKAERMRAVNASLAHDAAAEAAGFAAIDVGDEHDHWRVSACGRAGVAVSCLADLGRAEECVALLREVLAPDTNGPLFGGGRKRK